MNEAIVGVGAARAGECGDVAIATAWITVTPRWQFSMAGIASASGVFAEKERTADALVIATEWKVFQGEDAATIGALMGQKIVVDGRNCLDADAWKATGFRYRGMGRA